MSISRRKFFQTSAGVAGLAVLTPTPRQLLTAENGQGACSVEPQPIPHTIATPFGTTIHHFFPGPVEGVDPNTGHDPSDIFDFDGVVGQADLILTGLGTDLNTGDSAPYDFHTDMRFMKGRFVAADGNTHKGTFAFI